MKAKCCLQDVMQERRKELSQVYSYSNVAHFLTFEGKEYAHVEVQF